VINRNSRSGLIWLPWVIILAVIAGLFLVYTYIEKENRNAKSCRENLKQIYLALELFELDRGYLPTLDFYPSEPHTDASSLRVALANYGVETKHCLCPSSPDIVIQQGLSYVWNTKMNKRVLSEVDEPHWLLMDIQSVHEDVTGPHFRNVHVLYSDGSIQRSDEIPLGIVETY